MIHTLADRLDLMKGYRALDAVWPEYNNHGDGLGPLFERVEAELQRFQLMLLDSGGEVVARGRTAPLRWDGTVGGLPDGISDALGRAVEALDSGVAPNALCAISAEVRPDRRARGLSGEILKAMRALAENHQLDGGLIAPVRPSFKEHYPIIPIDRYAAWRRVDGLPFDPWMRVHARLGAKVLKTAPRSLSITASVAEWQDWVGLEFPESGTYVFPRGLAPLYVDRLKDVGKYWEPNVWMLHP